MMHHNRTTEFVKHAFLLLVLAFVFIPFFLMLSISLKSNEQFTANPWLPQLPFHWSNYVYAWHHIAPSILNTVYVAFLTMFFSLSVALLGSYFFARYKALGSNVLFFIFIILMMYPTVANMVPVFKTISTLGLYNSLWSLILVSTAGAQAMSIYILRNFIQEIPHDLFDAAEVDGCSMIGQIRHIVIPMCLPILGTLAILQIIHSWNEFVSPLIFLRDGHKQLISVALLHLEGEYTKHWGRLMAGYTIASLPLVILFLFCMKLFIRGLSQGAVKG
jgi:ABC-type glycerol-3-phosphate transport system permease component